MTMSGLLLLTIFTACFAMVTRWISTTVITAPMAFIGFGFLLSQTGLMLDADAEVTLHFVAEVALILLLFLDAAQIDLKKLRDQHQWPSRMLLIGLPLCIGLGTLAAWPFLPGWPLYAVALVACILAPTDAALGQVVITNPIVPERSRRTLTVESGLNDGLSLPPILLFASLTSMMMQPTAADWVLFVTKQLILGPLAGITVGLVGGAILLYSKKRNLTSETSEGIGAIALAGTAYLAAHQIGGNGFIAAFIAGLCFGNVIQSSCKFVYEFTEGEGQILSLGAFFLIGLALVPEALHELTLPMLAIILISLFIVRPVAIWLSLMGTDASPITRLFFGWFGPRGLATALFALLIVQQISPSFSDPILTLAVNTVWISALLHGLSAVPGAKWYAAKMAQRRKEAESTA